MRGKAKEVLAVLLVLILLLTAAGVSASPVSASGPSGIRWQPSDMWLWTDQTAYLSIYLENDAEAVHLEYYSTYYGGWEWLKPCDPQIEGVNTSWEARIDPATWGDDYITLRFKIMRSDGDFYSEEFTVNWTDHTGFERIAGANRFQTAISIADWKRLVTGGAQSKYPNVVIACGTDFADALGGAYLASVYNAPILLVNSNPGVIQDVAGEIQKNMSSDGMIFILGGTGAVSGDMESALTAGGFTESQIQRFSGANRYETNLRILQYCGVHRKEVLICSGNDFADALSASAVGLPIMITGSKLTEKQLDYLSLIEPEAISIIGGKGAVSEAVEEQVKPLVSGLPSRIWGNNRFETSKAVALWYFSGRQRLYATLAYGFDFPDGLAGGPLSLSLPINGPLLLVTDKNWQEADTALSSRTLGARELFVLGGPTLISDATVQKILERDETPDGPVGGPGL